MVYLPSPCSSPLPAQTPSVCQSKPRTLREILWCEFPVVKISRTIWCSICQGRDSENPGGQVRIPGAEEEGKPRRWITNSTRRGSLRKWSSRPSLCSVSFLHPVGFSSPSWVWVWQLYFTYLVYNIKIHQLINCVTEFKSLSLFFKPILLFVLLGLNLKYD